MKVHVSRADADARHETREEYLKIKYGLIKPIQPISIRSEQLMMLRQRIVKTE